MAVQDLHSFNPNIPSNYIVCAKELGLDVLQLGTGKTYIVRDKV